MFKKIALGVFCLVLCISANAFAKSNDLVKVGNDAVIEEGTAVGDVAVILGDLTVNGTAQNVAVIGGDLQVGSTGNILGDTAVIFGKIDKSPGAEVKKSGVEISPKKVFNYNIKFPVLTFLALGFFGAIILIGTLVIILLVALLFTGSIGKTSFYVQKNPWNSLLYGFIFALLILPIILLLAVSIIGIPLIPLFIIAVFVASFFGYTTMCQLFGPKFFNAINKPNQPMLLEVIVGFVIFCVLIVIPYIGWLLKTLIWMTGLGATVVTKFGKR